MTGAVNPEMITVARESRGMNQEQLAKAMEVSQSKLSKYETECLRSVMMTHPPYPRFWDTLPLVCAG